MQVLVLAAVRSSMQAIVESIASERPICVSNPVAVIGFLSGTQPDVIVLDPDDWSDDVFATLLPAFAASKAELIYYTQLRPANADRAVALASQRPVHVVLRGAEAAGLVLREAILNATHRSIPAALLKDVAPRLAHLPSGLAARSVGMFGSAEIPRWVDGMLDGSGVGRRSVDRWMSRAGLPSAAVVLDVARLARAWHLIVDDQLTVDEVSRRMGYRRTRTFNEHLRRYLRVTPSALGKQLTGSETLSRLRAELIAT
jgi:AraC-like DNA-binding protein